MITQRQKLNEALSIERFVAATMRAARPKGTNAAVTRVILAAAQAAADMAARDSAGVINQEQAARIFRDAARIMWSAP